MDPALIALIQAVLSPILLISAVGLLLLTLQNRYGRVIDRLRSFGEEIATLKQRMRYPRAREVSIKRQLGNLLKRGKLLRDAILFLYLGILCVILSSILIFVSNGFGAPIANITILAFSTALIFVLVGALFAIREMIMSYQAVTTQLVIEDGIDDGIM